MPELWQPAAGKREGIDGPLTGLSAIREDVRDPAARSERPDAAPRSRLGNGQPDERGKEEYLLPSTFNL